MAAAVTDDGIVRSVNPARPAEAVGEVALADADAVRAAVARARAAQVGWRELGAIARGRILRGCATAIERRADELAALMTAEEGKTIGESRVEIDLSVETLLYHAGHARDADGRTYPSSHPDDLVRTLRVPVGVVGMITPWNFPAQIPAWKAAPALVWGNAVVWKPSLETPVLSRTLADCLAEGGLPAGVLEVVQGGAETGRALVEHPDVDAITFTGSVPVGRAIAAAATARGAKVQLELGGHNAAIVCADVDPAWAASVVLAGAMGGTGQKCTATRRVIAVGDAHDALARELIAQVPALVVGDGADPATQIGPLVSDRAHAAVDAAVGQAIAAGAEVLARAPVPDGGWYYPPTVLAGTPDLAICREEVFGPVTVLLRAADVDAAIALANATPYGLSATVLTRDERTIRRCFDRLEAGVVKANAPTTGTELHAPFGGLRDSAFPAPREQNAETAADFCTWTKTTYSRLVPE
ncbi:MAG: aldehyde dehydrogenase family protein [Gaiellales bacterium]